MTDAINPDHYKDGPSCPHCGGCIECIVVARRFGFALGNVIKYLWRAPMKGAPLDDLRKARWYLDDEIRRLADERREKRGRKRR